MELRKEWYKKLDKEGFEDIENVDWDTGAAGGEGGSAGWLKGGSQAALVRSHSKSKEEYWRLVTKWSWQLKSLRTSRDRKIFRLYGEGITRQEIAKKLKVALPTVNRVIMSERKKMLAFFKAGNLLEAENGTSDQG